MSSWAANVHRFVLVELWCLTFDQFHPCLSICVAFGLEVVAAFGRKEAEEVLSAAFWVFEVPHSVEVSEADLLEETFFNGRFVEGEKIWAKDQVKGFPLLRADKLVRCKPWSRMGKDLRFPGAFMHLSTSKYAIEDETTILVDRRKGIEIQVTTA